MNKKTLFLSIFAYALSFSTNLEASINGNSFYLGIGNLSEFSSKIQTDNQGNTQFFTFSPLFQAGLKYKIKNRFFLIPELALTLPKSGRDKQISKFKYFTLLSGAYQKKSLFFRIGFGFALQRISGKGGTQSLSNGLGTTDFPMPESTSVSRNLIALLGVEYFVNKEWSTRLEIFVYNPESSKRRAFSHTANLMYHFKGFNFF